MKIAVILPAFNEAAVISQVLKSLPKKLLNDIKIDYIVIDDGSTDTTRLQAENAGFKVVSHPLNRGLGAAIKTGLEWAQLQKADIAVTFDSDGQHDPSDISKIISPILNKQADLVIGTRFKNLQSVPPDRLILNWFANLATLVLFGVVSTDSQSGLRAFSKEAIKLIDFKGERMDFSSEILLEAKKHNLRVKEVPVSAVYTKYSRAKGQKNLNSLAILLRFLIKIFR